MPNLLALLKLVRWLQCDKPDVIQTWMYHADLLGSSQHHYAQAEGWWKREVEAFVLINSLRIFQLAVEAIRRVTQPNRATDKQSALDDQRIDGTSRSGQQGEMPPWLQGEVGLDMATYMEPQDSAWKVFQAYAEEYRIFLHGFPNSGLGQG